MLDTVYVDTRNNLVVAIRPKSAFRSRFWDTASREGFDIRVVNEPLNGSAVFLVETGESQSLPEAAMGFLNKLASANS